MVEAGAVPGGRRVTALALARESGGIVVGVFRGAHRSKVARLALCAAVDELQLSLGGGHVTGGAVRPNVCPGQRESRRSVRAHHGDAVDEAARRMAARTVGAELTAVDIRVAAGARRAHLPELERPVASRARRAGMSTLERKPTRMSEVAPYASRFPGRDRVTLGTRRR